MKRILPTLLLAVGAGGCCLCGCASMEPVAADRHPGFEKYYSAENMRDYTLLKDDSTFVVHQSGSSFGGTYSVDGKTLLLTPTDGNMSLLGSIDGRIITDNDGKKWIRQEYSFFDRVLCRDPWHPFHNKSPKGWLIRPWEGKLYVCKRPKGRPPPRLDAEAIIVVLRHGESDRLATTKNMIADTKEYTIHLSFAPSGTLWPDAKKDLLDILLRKPRPEPE